MPKSLLPAEPAGGVHITMDNVHYSVPDTVSNVKFFREANEIIMQ